MCHLHSRFEQGFMVFVPMSPDQVAITFELVVPFGVKPPFDIGPGHTATTYLSAAA